MPSEPRAGERCAGSGGYPAEQVILDVVPGMDPKGTCPSCRQFLTMRMYRLPEHEVRT